MLSSIASNGFDYTRLSPYPFTALTNKVSDYGIPTAETEEQLR